MLRASFVCSTRVLCIVLLCCWCMLGAVTVVDGAVLQCSFSFSYTETRGSDVGTSAVVNGTLTFDTATQALTVSPTSGGTAAITGFTPLTYTAAATVTTPYPVAQQVLLTLTSSVFGGVFIVPAGGGYTAGETAGSDGYGTGNELLNNCSCIANCALSSSSSSSSAAPSVSLSLSSSSSSSSVGGALLQCSFAFSYTEYFGNSKGTTSTVSGTLTFDTATQAVKIASESGDTVLISGFTPLNYTGGTVSTPVYPVVQSFTLVPQAAAFPSVTLGVDVDVGYYGEEVGTGGFGTGSATLTDCSCIANCCPALPQPQLLASSTLMPAPTELVYGSQAFSVANSTAICGVGIAINTAAMGACDVAQLQLAIYQTDKGPHVTQVAATANVAVYSTQAPNGQYLYIPFVGGSVQLNASATYLFVAGFTAGSALQVYTNASQSASASGKFAYSPLSNPLPSNPVPASFNFHATVSPSLVFAQGGSCDCFTASALRPQSSLCASSSSSTGSCRLRGASGHC